MIRRHLSDTTPTNRTAYRDSGDWRDSAACLNHQTLIPDAWHQPERGHMDQNDEARQVCLTQCAVRDKCLQWALEHERDLHDASIFGGLDGNERKALKRKATRPTRAQDPTVCRNGLHPKDGPGSCKQCANEGAARRARAKKQRDKEKAA